MGIWDRFKKEDKPFKSNLDDAARTNSAIIRQHKAALKQAQQRIELLMLQKQMKDLEHQLKSYDGDSGSEEGALLQQILQFASLKEQQPKLREITDSDIDEMIKQQDKALIRKAKRMRKSDLILYLQTEQKLPLEVATRVCARLKKA